MREVSSRISVSRDSGPAARSVVTRRQCLTPSAGSLRPTRRLACSCLRAASHVSSDHGRGLEYVLVAAREPIDARREDGLNGLGQHDLVDRGGQPVEAAFTTQDTALDERANHLLDEERVAAGPGLDPVAQGCEDAVGSEPVVEQRVGVPESKGRERETRDP